MPPREPLSAANGGIPSGASGGHPSAQSGGTSSAGQPRRPSAWVSAGRRTTPPQSEELVLPGEKGSPGRKSRIRKRKPRKSGAKFYVAMLVLVILIGSAFAYLDSWPLTYVVESNSMQHGPGDRLGDLNAGDIVFIHNIPISSIVPYVVGVGIDHRTYGEPGDVLLFYPDGYDSVTPILHRAILFLSWDGNGTYGAQDLKGLQCSNDSGSPSYYVTDLTDRAAEMNHCAYAALGPQDALSLYNVGRVSPVTVDLGSTALGNHSGFLTLGDNNTAFDQTPSTNGTSGGSSLVEPAWIVGVAVGMIPWFGAIELAVLGAAGNVSPASWAALELTSAALLLVALMAVAIVGLRRGLHRRRESSRRTEQRERGRDLPSPRGGSGYDPGHSPGPRIPVASHTGEARGVVAGLPPRYVAGTLWPQAPAGEAPSPRTGMSADGTMHETRRRSHFVTPGERPRRPPPRT
jgi:signal peptidase I